MHWEIYGSSKVRLNFCYQLKNPSGEMGVRDIQDHPGKGSAHSNHKHFLAILSVHLESNICNYTQLERSGFREKSGDLLFT